MSLRLLLSIVIVAVSSPAWADIVIDFESFVTSDPSNPPIVTDQIPGLTFTNSQVLTDGVTLGDPEFPPHSEINLAAPIDFTAPITIAFSTPVFGFSGYFTYAQPLSLLAFDGATPVGEDLSAFSSNLALSGDSGSLPNELLTVSSPGGITSVIITGGAAGDLFTMDDLTVATSAPGVPEAPAAWLSFALFTCIAPALRKVKIFACVFPS